jgi:Reverse transcriptase (RNA-dependent DNA polymerase)/Group II intron, maturase-specific domain
MALINRNRFDELPSTNPMAANACWAFQTFLSVCSKKPSYKSSPRSSIRASRNRATGFDPNALLTEQPSKFDDKAVLQLIGRYLRAGVIVAGILQPTTEGTPQGGPMSPLLANILLDDLDKELENRGLPFVRYADDFVIFTKSRRSAERVFSSVNRYLTRRLRLVVNLAKSRIVPSREVEYLGFAFIGSRATINVSKKSIDRFKHRIREITGRSRGISMERRLSELRSFVRGWMGYYGLASQLKLFASLEQCHVFSCRGLGSPNPVLLLEALASRTHTSPRAHRPRRPASPSRSTREKS